MKDTHRETASGLPVCTKGADTRVVSIFGSKAEEKDYSNFMQSDPSALTHDTAETVRRRRKIDVFNLTATRETKTLSPGERINL